MGWQVVSFVPVDTPTREHWQTVLDNTGLVWFHLNRRRMTGDEREAAYADGCLGLLRAAQKFDPDKGFTFGTYAMWWIRESVSRGIADRKTLNARYAASKGEAYRPPVSLDTAPVGGGENENLVFSDIIADPRVDVAGQNEVSERLDMVVAAMTVGARDSVDLAIIEALGDKPGWHASIASRFGISGGTVRRRAALLRQYARAADAGHGMVDGRFDPDEFERQRLDDPSIGSLDSPDTVRKRGLGSAG